MSLAVEYFEIDLPYCGLTYGVAPCTASLTSSPPTGSAKCFNSFATCQDTPHFTQTIITLRFAKPAQYLPRDIDCLPWISMLDFSPAGVSLGDNVGTRATLKVTLSDHRHSDAGLDKYASERGYDPYTRGSFWPRFRARWPSLQGAACRWRIGQADQALEEFETRQFFIESYDGPGADGAFSFNAKDVLKFLDGDRAQAPLLSRGVLLADITLSATSATLLPVGVGAEYPSSGFVRIAGSEDVAYTRAGDVLTMTRAQFGSIATDHKAGDRVQTVLRYAAMDPADIINNLLLNYSDLPPSYISLAEWKAETAAYLGTLFTYTLGEPAALSAILNRIIEQAGLALWDDAVAQKLRLRVIRAVPITAQTISEDNVINQTFEPTDQPEKRASRCWVYYALSDPTKRLDDLNNYRAVAKVEDLNSEAIYGQAIRKIYADGIAAGGSGVADRIGTIIVNRFAVPPRRLKFAQQRGHPAPALGEGCNIDWYSLQDASGARALLPAQVVKFKPSPTTVALEAEEMRFAGAVDADPTVRTLRIDFNSFSVNLRTMHDEIYPSSFAGITKVVFTVAAGVIAGSDLQSLPAIDVGSWPGGLPIIIVVTGRIQGKGGDGGTAQLPSKAGGAGQAGGIALYTRNAVKVANAAGQIYGGGGGGAGSGQISGTGNIFGGGGGAGQLPGAIGPGTVGPVASDATTEIPGITNNNGQHAGNGGFPGLPGGNGQGTAAGGAAGAGIDGVSFVQFGTWDGTNFSPGGGLGDVRGPQIN